MPYRVESVHIHPQYNGERVGINGYHNDIVVYTLEENIVFNEYQNKISLPVKNVGPATKVVVSGWGITFYPTKRIPEQIQKLSLIAMDPANCYKKFNISIVADEICTFTKGAGVCNGDSGGPVVRHDKLVGIVSHGFPCVMGMPDIHTNI
ncbi:PREDICTED: chymotrypsin-2-like [Ceratosolen solmsi marchali]|uniref:Chymotrypsin-2-like n=1 Tax=Ceratosolen solmsi marchali TaxID=326594 RepID=A0AAJ6YUT9_9HYME|nr:PREDICTED: chymotrypsin-2-like [Ceratosolen solmsi marchali]